MLNFLLNYVILYLVDFLFFTNLFYSDRTSIFWCDGFLLTMVFLQGHFIMSAMLH